MIAELFYPKELKEVIKDLREKDDLNEEALENIHKSTIIRKLIQLALACVFLCFAFILEDVVVSIGLIFLSLLFWAVLCFPIAQANRFIMPYACGKKITTKISGADYNFIPSCSPIGWSMNYEFIDQKGEKHRGHISGIKSSDLKNGSIKAGDEIEIYYMPSYPSKNIPLLPSKFNKFSLKTNRGES